MFRGDTISQARMWAQLEAVAQPLRRRLETLYGRLARERGQALVEYTLIIALIAIVAIAALTKLGDGIVQTLEQITSSL